MEGKSYLKSMQFALYKLEFIFLIISFFFLDILEIFRVYVRIKKSFNQSSCESKQLENLISTIDSHLNNFKSLYLKAGLPVS